MEQLIKDLLDSYELVKYHDDRANRDLAIKHLVTMIGTTEVIKQKCVNMIEQMN